jgi:hypothetical protein
MASIQTRYFPNINHYRYTNLLDRWCDYRALGMKAMPPMVMETYYYYYYYYYWKFIFIYFLLNT